VIIYRLGAGSSAEGNNRNVNSTVLSVVKRKRKCRRVCASNKENLSCRSNDLTFAQIRKFGKRCCF